VDATISNLADAIATGGLRSSPILAERLQAAEAARRGIAERLEVPLSVLPPGSVARAVREATEALADMLKDLPEQLSDPAEVQEARSVLRDWMGDIMIEPTARGPVARWRLAESGLLLAAGRLCPFGHIGYTAFRAHR
jgi:hypothetical protein